MKYGILLPLIALVMFYLAYLYSAVAALFVWGGVSFLLVGIGYLFNYPGIFGKLPDGKMRLPSQFILLPYLIISWVSWHLERIISKENVYDEIVPGIWLGRRAFSIELPAEAELIVDLVAEFPAAAGVADKYQYISAPLLDAAAPNKKAMTELLNALKDKDERMYIHCAQGHGRSATVLAAILILRGVVGTLAEAEQLIKSKRPKVHIHKAQANAAEMVIANLTA